MHLAAAILCMLATARACMCVCVRVCKLGGSVVFTGSRRGIGLTMAAPSLGRHTSQPRGDYQLITNYKAGSR